MCPLLELACGPLVASGGNAAASSKGQPKILLTVWAIAHTLIYAGKYHAHAIKRAELAALERQRSELVNYTRTGYAF